MDKTLIEKAAAFARWKHKGQKDDSGKSYFLAHLEHVASILIAADAKEEIIAAAYLHDTLEDTDTTYEELLEAFGQEVADLVHEVTHEGEKDAYGFYFPRLKSKDGITLKLADRMSNIMRMDSWDKKRQKHYLKKTKFWKDGKDRE